MASAEGEPLRAAVLVVDDEKDILHAFKMYIERSLPGVSVATAESGHQALALLRERSFDLIISDYKMPGMNGVEFLKEVDHVAPGVPRIMVTAYPDLDISVRAINEGHITQFLTKPVEPLKMVEVVHDILAQRRATTARMQAFARAMELMREKGVQPSIGAIPPTPRG